MNFYKKNNLFFLTMIVGLFLMGSCNSGKTNQESSDMNEIKLITLDPAHFHAALVQKIMYPGIDSVVHVYAHSENGLGLQEQLKYIEQYNHRDKNPTHWVEKVYTGKDFLDKMLTDKEGNVVVLAGNNQQKTEYIKKSVDAGMNVLADKPMAISTGDFDLLKQAFADAEDKGVILYDIMTERSEITSLLQKALVHTPSVFGEMTNGTADSPAVVMESVHRYFKQVSGKPLVRPDWFFDPLQEGDAIADVGTHLVDLVQWICFPEVVLHDEKDVNIQSARIWPTPLSLSQFSNITKVDHFPDFLQKYVKGDSLLTHGNGTINYTLKGMHARVTTRWTYDAPPGAGDTYDALIRGTKASLEIRQGEEEDFHPTFYIWPTGVVKDKGEYVNDLKKAIKTINESYSGVSLVEYKGKSGQKEGWKVMIPEKYKVGHEAHFGQVMERYLKYLKNGELPKWEVPGMITKYYTTTKGLEMAQKN